MRHRHFIGQASRGRASGLGLAVAVPGLAQAIFLIFSTEALEASAHGSRLVPIEDRPLPQAPVTPEAAPKEPQSPAPRAFRWTGFYLGGHVAYKLARADNTLFDPGPVTTTDSLGSFFGGVQIGYNYHLPSRILVGVEGDLSFPYFVEDGAVMSRRIGQGLVTEKLDFASTLRARAGYALDGWLIYATGGLAWSQARFTETPTAIGAVTSTVLNWPIGWTAGAGAELVFAPPWSIKAEYRFDLLREATGTFASGSGYRSSETSIHSVQIGLNWHFDLPGAPSTPSGAAGNAWPTRAEDWSVHWQSTFIEQGYFRFHSPYEGAHSLSSNTQFQDTFSATAFVGLRLWEGAQFYVDPELDQGFGLSQALGVAAFPNGEAQKTSYPVPRLNMDRLILRQTFGLGGERVAVGDGPNQLPGTRDVSRITIAVGRLSVGDAFGLNTYAQDPRTQFLNWNIYGSGSYDWTMDQPGFTWGALAELNERGWALRVGYFLEPTESNGNSFDTNMPTHGQYLAEPEVRYALFSQPGIVRMMAWVTRANMGSYSEAVAMPITTPNYPDITETRQMRVTYGFVANVEQALSRDLGVFSKASWTPGLVEVMGWTDCDQSLSLGASLTGTAWRRPGDTVGFAGVIEGLSPEARAYFAAGGLGILIGDGRLDYRPEEVAEAYYSVSLATWATLTFDYQLVANPAYNADRGPVPVYAARLHLGE